MRKLNQTGSLVAPLIIITVLFLGAAGFGIWAVLGRQDYKANSDKKSAEAAKEAIAAEDIKKDAAFAEAQKSPFRTFTGPEALGSVSFQYPKTWSGYLSGISSTTSLDAYFMLGLVPDTHTETSFSLRAQIVDSPYATVAKNYDSNAKAGKSIVTPYKAPKVESVTGTKITGLLDGKKTGIMVLLPIRDKTIKIWTEGSDFESDFTSTVLATLTFNP